VHFAFEKFLVQFLEFQQGLDLFGSHGFLLCLVRAETEKRAPPFKEHPARAIRQRDSVEWIKATG
jgi:hypothetical protein